MQSANEDFQSRAERHFPRRMGACRNPIRGHEETSCVSAFLVLRPTLRPTSESVHQTATTNVCGNLKLNFASSLCFGPPSRPAREPHASPVPTLSLCPLLERRLSESLVQPPWSDLRRWIGIEPACMSLCSLASVVRSSSSPLLLPRLLRPWRQSLFNVPSSLGRVPPRK